MKTNDRTDGRRPRYSNDDERSSRKPNVYIERAKQVEANKNEWRWRAVASIHQGLRPATREAGDYNWIMNTQVHGKRVTYRNGHLELA
jgi:hypothetical protein